MAVRHLLYVALVVALVLPAEMPAGQTPADARHAVAYVEVEPSGVRSAAAAFRDYRAAVQQEAGFVGLDVFEQIGRPGHFALIGTWRDQPSFDAHQTASSFTRLRAALDVHRTSGYDQRPYRDLATGPARAAARGAVAVVSHVDIGGGAKVDAPALLRALAEASRAEVGCVRFDVVQSTTRGNHFTVVEVWADQQALDRHTAAAHTRKFRDDVQPATGSPLDERVYTRVE